MAIKKELINEYRYALLHQFCNNSVKNNNNVQKVETKILASGGAQSDLESERQLCSSFSQYLEEIL